MMTLECWCAEGRCHQCQQKRPRLYRCLGCRHRFCFCCAHRIGSGFACVACTTTWLNVMCALDMPQPVSTWLNALAFCEDAS